MGLAIWHSHLWFAEYMGISPWRLSLQEKARCWLWARQERA